MASRKEQKERLRQERLEAEAAATAGSEKRRTLGLAVGIFLAAAAAGAVAVVLLVGGGDGGGPGGGGSGPDERDGAKPPAIKSADLEQTAKAAGCKLRKKLPDEGNQHVPEKKWKFKTKPPTSGNHNVSPHEDGAFLDEPKTGHFVHSLEHGRINIQYAPKLPEDAQLKLKGLFDEDPAHMLLFPYKDMPYEVAATAWTHLLGCPKYNEQLFDAIRAFKDEYRDQGPELVG